MKRDLEFISKLARDAGRIMLVASKGRINYKVKEVAYSLVTETDLKIEKYIQDTLGHYFPEDKLLSEETHSEIKDAKNLDNLWIIDPIDGTNNFKFHLNYSCVSIGLMCNGEVVLGAVYNPFADELFTAATGEGAHLNGEEIRCGKPEEFGFSTILIENYYSDASLLTSSLNAALASDPKAWIMIRGSIALGLCDIAAGRADLLAHFACKPWDIAAGSLIIKESGGGVYSDLGEFSVLGDRVVAGKPELAQKFLKAYNNQ